MTIHPFHSGSPPTLRPQQQHPDSASAYDTTWTEQPASSPQSRLEEVMLSDGKIYVVLAVVCVIWIGLLIVLFRTDRRIDRLERRLDQDIPGEDA